MDKKGNKDKPVSVRPKQSPVTDVEIAPGAQSQFSLSHFRVQALLLAVIAFIFYCNTFQHGSAFDDRMAISENEYVQQGVSGIPDIMTKDAYQSYLEHKNGGNQLAGGRYRPLSLTTFAIEQQVMGSAHDNEKITDKETRITHEMHARHVVNVLLYMLSAMVLLYFLRTVVFADRPLIAFVTALLFVIHPIHTEVVANVKSRDEILSLLFISLTFIQAFRYREQKKIKNLWLAILCFFLALLSKEYAVTLIVLLPLSFYLFRKEGLNSSIMATIPYLAPLGVYLLLRFSAVTAVPEGAENNIMNNPYLYATGAQKIATELLVLLDYLKLLIWPHPLSADYSYNAIPYTDFSNPLVWLSVMIYSALIVGMYLLIKRRHVLGFAIAIYLVNLLLVSNIFFDIGAPMGERLIYHSSVGFFMAVAYLLYTGLEKTGRPKMTMAGIALVMTILVVLCGYKTIDRNADWKNDQTLFMKDVQTVPNSILANNNAAAACMLSAKHIADDAKRNEWFARAISYFDKAIALYPMYMNARLNRGLCYFDMGQPDRAAPDWDTVRKYEPGDKNVNYYFSVLGKFYYGEGTRCDNTGKTDSSIIAFRKGTEAMPELADMWYKLGNAYMTAGRKDEAQAAFQRAEQLKMKTNR